MVTMGRGSPVTFFTTSFPGPFLPWERGCLFQSRHHNHNSSNHSWLHPRVDCRRSEISRHVFSWDGYHQDGYQIRRNDARSMLHCIALCTWRTCLGAAPISRQINVWYWSFFVFPSQEYLGEIRLRHRKMRWRFFWWGQQTWAVFTRRGFRS